MYVSRNGEGYLYRAECDVRLYYYYYYEHRHIGGGNKNFLRSLPLSDTNVLISPLILGGERLGREENSILNVQ